MIDYKGAREEYSIFLSNLPDCMYMYIDGTPTIITWCFENFPLEGTEWNGGVVPFLNATQKI